MEAKNMKLEVGMYVRTYEGFVAKCISKYYDDVFNCIKYRFDGTINKWEGHDGFCFETEIAEQNLNNIIKITNKDLIQLLEVGDYVNGYKVIDKVTNWKVIVDYLELDTKDGNYYNKYFFKEDIKSIVTKEQFEAMEYKIN